MTFTLGLAAFWMADGLSIAWREGPVDLQIAESSDVILIFPTDQIPGFGSSGPDTRLDFGECGFVPELMEPKTLRSHRQTEPLR